MRLIGQVFSWVSTLIVIRVLAPSDYGATAVAQVMVGLVVLINEVGLAPALIQAREAPSPLVQSVHGYVLLINVVLYGLLFFLAPGIADFYEDDGLVSIIRALGLQLVIGAFGSVPLALAKRNLSFKHISMVNLLATVLASATSLALALLGAGVWALVAASLVLCLVQSFGVMLITRFNLRPSLRLEGMNKLLSFGAWVSGGRLIWYLAQNIDDLLVGKLLGNVALGQLTVAKNLAALPLSRVMEILNQITFPMYSRLDGDLDRAFRYFLKSVWLGMLIFCPLTWGLSSMADVFTEVVLGDRWVAAALPIRIIALSIPAMAINFLLAPVVDALGRPDITFRNTVTRLAVLVVSIFFGMPWGLNGICISISVARVVTLLIFLRIASRILPLSWRDIWTASREPVLAGIAMYAGTSILVYSVGEQVPPTILLGAGCVLGCLIYVGVLLSIAPLTVQKVRSVFQQS